MKDRYDWTIADDFIEEELNIIYQTAHDIETYADGVTGGNGLDWMQYAFGGTTIVHSQHESGRSFTWPGTGGALMQLDQNWMTHPWGANVLFAHELGHVWDINSRFSHSGEMNRDLGGSSWCYLCDPGDGVPQWNSLYHPSKGDAYGNSARNEYFAEAFAATIYTPLDPSYVPSGVSDWISWQISTDLINYLVPGGTQ